jgi:hypothetical protein
MSENISRKGIIMRIVAFLIGAIMFLGGSSITFVGRALLAPGGLFGDPNARLVSDTVALVMIVFGAALAAGGTALFFLISRIRLTTSIWLAVMIASVGAALLLGKSAFNIPYVLFMNR